MLSLFAQVRAFAPACTLRFLEMQDDHRRFPACLLHVFQVCRAIKEDTPLATISSTLENTRGERRFFSAMAAAIVVMALAGFARTYFLRPLLPVLEPAPMALTPLIHLHGLLFTGWVLLLLAQG